MPFNRGEIVAVPYPFTDLTGSKTRPALIVSSDLYNRSCPDILVAAITTQLSRVTSFDHVLTDWKGAGLRYQSASQRSSRSTGSEFGSTVRGPAKLPGPICLR